MVNISLEELEIFVKDRIKELTALYEQTDEASTQDYLAGCIDAYDIVRIKISKN